MKLKTYMLLTAALPVVVSMSSCSLGIKSAITKSYPPLNPTDTVTVIPLKDAVPTNAEIVGTVRIYDAGTFNCGYDVVIEAAKTEARKAGGNALKITEHLFPSLWSSCHQITAIILKLNVDSGYADTSQQRISPQPEYPVRQNQAKNNNLYKAFYLTAEGGWSWRINKIDPSLNSFQRDYISELNSGHHYGFSAMYYLNRGIGLGLMYDNFVSSNSVQASAVDTSEKTVTGQLRDNISINLIAASVDFRGFSKSGKNSYHAKISFGYCGYKDVGGFIDYGIVTGNTLGLSYDFSYDINLVDHWYIAPSFAYRVGTLFSYDVTINNNTQHVNLDKDHYEGLSRIDLSAALRYKW